MECHQISPPDDDDANHHHHRDDDNCNGTAAAAFESWTDRILRSVGTVCEGTTGPYRCSYSVRIAYELVDERTQAWIRMWLARFEKRPAATAVESYPSPRDVFLPPANSGGGGGGGGSPLFSG